MADAAIEIEHAPLTVAVVGAGVIGAGWAARFLRAGHHIRLFDPAPSAPAVVDKTLANAQAAWADLGIAPVAGGSLIWCEDASEAADGADLVQESVPERLELKHRVLAEVAQATGPEVLIASSTSGFRPSVLAEPLAHPERVVVAHPFQPVYLLPVVELVGGDKTDDAALERVAELYHSVGMRPVRVRAEIDAFIADRLLEAVWREALWLVNDGVATTGEIDDVIRYGFGLRWAQMGLFDTYRVAGGEGGMRHFIAQFGEALDWPWTKLTDTPELTDELVDRIASQSDEQSGHLSIVELERLRDRNLVAILRALEGVDWGAGREIARLRHGAAPSD